MYIILSINILYIPIPLSIRYIDLISIHSTYIGKGYYLIR